MKTFKQFINEANVTSWIAKDVTDKFEVIKTDVKNLNVDESKKVTANFKNAQNVSISDSKHIKLVGSGDITSELEIDDSDFVELKANKINELTCIRAYKSKITANTVTKKIYIDNSSEIEINVNNIDNIDSIYIDFREGGDTLKFNIKNIDETIDVDICKFIDKLYGWMPGRRKSNDVYLNGRDITSIAVYKCDNPTADEVKIMDFLDNM